MQSSSIRRRSAGNQRSTTRLLALLGLMLATITAVVYLMISLDFAPDSLESPPKPVMLLVAAGYLAGGALILRLDRRLLMLGAALNLLVLVAFFISLLLGRAEIEAYSIISKLAQIGLQGVLIALVQQLSHPNADRRLGSTEING